MTIYTIEFWGFTHDIAQIKAYTFSGEMRRMVIELYCPWVDAAEEGEVVGASG